MRNVLQITARHVLAVYAIRAFHSIPVIFVRNSTPQADLVVMTVVVDAGPGKAMGAGVAEDQL